jgi:hypothetical protein
VKNEQKPLSRRVVSATLFLIPILFVSHGAASPTDTPATFDCEYTSNAPAGQAVSLFAVDFSRSGQLLMSGSSGAANTEEEKLAVIGTNCGLAWGITSTTGGAPFNQYGSAAFDGASRVLAEHLFGDGAGNDNRTLRLLFNGAVLKSTANLLVSIGPSYDASDIDDLRVNATHSAFFVAHTSGVVTRYTDDLAQYFSTSNTARTVRGGQDVAALYTRTASNFYQRVNPTTGAVLHTSVVSTGASKPPIRSTIDATNVYQGLNNGNTMSYHKLLASTFATVSATVAVTDNQVDVGAGPAATATNDFDLDGQDNLLLCGAISGASFAAKIRTSDNTHRWNITTSRTGMLRCGFDYVGGFWLAGTGTSGGTGYFWARHYSGGDFAPPPAPGLVTPPDNDVFGDAEGNPIEQMVQVLSEAWGFDWSWIIGAIIMAICVAAVKDFNDLVTGLIIVLVAVANVKLGLWAEWAIFLMVFIVLALAGNRLFGKKGDADGDSA